MAKQDPKGFIVVVPGEIIEIPQDSYSWVAWQFFNVPDTDTGKRRCAGQ